MADKTRGSKIKYRFLKKWRRPAAALLALAVLLGGICYRYFLFMSQTVYRESTSHLSEILRKSDNMLNHLVSRNQMLLHLWNDFLKNASSEEQIRSSLNEMQKETGCAALYFLGRQLHDAGRRKEQPWLADRSGHAAFRRRGRRCECGAARKAADARVCLPGDERHLPRLRL